MQYSYARTRQHYYVVFNLTRLTKTNIVSKTAIASACTCVSYCVYTYVYRTWSERVSMLTLMQMLCTYTYIECKLTINVCTK